MPGNPPPTIPGFNTPNIPGGDMINTPMSKRIGSKVTVTVLAENEKPLKDQAIVRLTSYANGRVYFLTTHDSQAIFDPIPPAKYLIEIGAAGYVGKHSDVVIPDTLHDLSEKVILTRDPTAPDLKLSSTEQIPSGARKEAEKGLQSIQLSNLVDARKHLEAANHKYAGSSSINFLLAYVASQQSDPDRELAHLNASIHLDPNNIQAQNLLGQLQYQRGEYAHAVEAEEVVLKASSESLIARKILANSYLKLHDWDKAREHAQWLVDHGGSEGASARLILGQALAGLQKNEDAIKILTAYLDHDPASPVAPQIRDLITKLKAEQKVDAEAPSTITLNDPELANNSGFSNTGMPPDLDTQNPQLVAGVQCPADLLESTELPSKKLVDNVSQIAAVEHMVHENLSLEGTPRTHESRQFNYVALISDSNVTGLAVQEYRQETNMPDDITTTGLAVLALAFHPVFRNDFAMRCEGLGNWQGRPAWVVHFRQRDDQPTRIRSYLVNKVPYPVHLKGRAWVLADNHQIIHLETDLARQIPEIGLKTEHTVVTYGPVEFKSANADLWLPKTAELYVEMGKLRFRRSENFDHFMLFGTDVQEQRKVPSSTENQSTTANPPSPGK